jgi:hypothetical protein
MSRKMSSTNVLTLWHGGDDLPPAAAAKQPKRQSKEVIDLTAAILRAYRPAGSVRIA